MKSLFFVFAITIFSFSLSNAEGVIEKYNTINPLDSISTSTIEDSLRVTDSTANHVSFAVGIGIGAGMRVGLEVPVSNSNFLQFGLGLYYANLLGGEYPPFGLEALFTSVSLVNNKFHLFDRTSLLLTIGSTYVQALRTKGTNLYFLAGTGFQIGNSTGEHFQFGIGVGYRWMVVQGDREADDGFFPNVDFLFVW